METLSIQLQPFIEWLLRSTLQASLLICLILLVQTILRSKLGIRWHYCFWLLLLVRMVMPWSPNSRVSLYNLIPQSITPQQFEDAGQAISNVSTSPDTAVTGTGETTQTAANSAVQAVETESYLAPDTITELNSQEPVTNAPLFRPEPDNWLRRSFFQIVNVLPIIWLAGALLLAVYICVGNFNLWRIVKQQHPLTNQKILDLLEDCKDQMGVQTIFGIVPTDKVNSPALFGFIRPRLLLPQVMLETLSQQEQRYILLHELAHLKRHDIYIGWLTSLLQILHWFNPLVWLAFYRMRSDRELACDALVLTRTKSIHAKDYGGVIVGLVERFSQIRRLPAMAGIMENKTQLKRRITMISKFKKNSYQWSPLAILLIIILGCVSLPDAISTKVSDSSITESAPPISLSRVWSGPDVDCYGAPSPDGRYLSYVDWETGDLAVYEIATGQKRRLTNKGTWEESYEFAQYSKWSPDGKQIVYNWFNENSFFELRIIDLDGTKPRILYRNEEVEYLQPCDWSPDGKQVLAGFDKKDGNQIVLVSVADGSVRVLKTVDKSYPDASFSPDGRYIVNTYRQIEELYQSNRDISLISTDGSREIPLVEHPADDFVLGWAPDGKKILFASDRTGTLGVWLIAVADEKPQGAPEMLKPDIGQLEPLGFTQKGSFYYGFSRKSDDIYVATLDQQTGKIIAPLEKAIQRYEGSNITAAYSPDGKYLAYIRRSGTLTQHSGYILCVHSLETDKQHDFTLNFTLGPNVPRWSPNGRSLLVVGNKDNITGLYQIDTQTGGVKLVVPQVREDGSSFNSFDWSADGESIFYVHLYKLCRILVRDLANSIEKELYRSEDDVYSPYRIAVSSDGKWLALNSQLPDEGLGSLKVIQVTGGEAQELCKFEENFGALTLSADGKYIFFARKVSDDLEELCRITTEGGEIEKLGLEMKQIQSLSVHPDGQHILVSGQESAAESEVWVMENFLPEAPVAKPASATTLRMVTDHWKRGYASVSADGKYMTELDFNTDDLVVREIATGKKQILTSGNGYALDSLISPDGQKIAYFWDGPIGDETGLCIIGIDGSGRQLLRQNEYLVPRDWSSDGKQILGILIGEDQNTMVWVSISDGTMDQIKPIGKAYPEKFDISPDGRFIAYDRPKAEETSKRDIFLFDIEQAQERRLVDQRDDDKLLGWTPNGQSIFFASNRVGTWDGWLLDVADGKPKGLPRLAQVSIGDVTPIGFTQNGDYYFGRYEMRFGVYTTKLNLDTGEILATPSVIRHTGQEDLPSWSPDGQYLAYCSRTEENSQIIHIRDVETGQERVLDPNLPYFDWLCWCPDSQSLLATSFKETPPILYRIDAQTGQRRVLLRSETVEICGAELSPDDKSLFYLQGPEDKSLIGKILVKDLQTDREREILSFELNYGLPWWSLSPDGLSLAIGLHEREGDVLKTISIETGQTKDLFRSQTNERIETIAWMPDGNNILYWVDRLWRISAEGGQPQNLRTPEGVEISRHLSVHPDGQRIAFGALGLIDQVWVMENFLPEETVVKSVMLPKFTKIQIPNRINQYSQLSPDGKSIAFVNDNRIWIMPMSSRLGPGYSGEPRLLDTGEVLVDYTDLTWSGDSKWIAFNGKQIENGCLKIYIVSADGGEPREVHENNRHSIVLNYRMSLSPDGKTLAFSTFDGHGIYVETISVEGGSPKRLVDAPSREPVFSPDGYTIAYVESKNLGAGGGALWTVPASGGTPTLVADANNASSPVWSPEGRMIAFIDYGADFQIYLVPVTKDGRPAGKKFKLELPEGTEGATRITGWTPDNKITALYFKKEEFALYTRPIENGKASFVTVGGYPLQPRWSPDGKLIYHTNNPDDTSGDWERYAIAYVPSEGGDVTTIPIKSEDKITIWGYGAGNRVSPDGKTIVFAGQTVQEENLNRLNIWTIPTEGGEPERLTSPPPGFTDWYPCWSHDGQDIVFVRQNLSDDQTWSTPDEGSIYVVSSEGGEPSRITWESDRVYSPGPVLWSPDGELLAFYSLDKDKVDGALCVIQPNGGELKVVANVESKKELAWSPDSKRIAFQGSEEGVIKIVSLEDGNLREIKVDLVDTEIYHLDWSPDGESLAFAGYTGGGMEFWMIENFLPESVALANEQPFGNSD